ncbi:hypothetical protein AQUCO_02700169v1 [Aquilegia coerulea]|uniref:non-specific serine/threonine protein kinase n=1 Tax=Aquilegia coerulea TaxID=218851 RepID=A0A2G5D5K2_AQUCA|nr:hypothetical protein AQUCO_02700169v1 [Aquilegia coerulea]
MSKSIDMASKQQQEVQSGVPYLGESHDVDDDMYYTTEEDDDDGGKSTVRPPPYFGNTPVFDEISELYISGEDDSIIVQYDDDVDELFFNIMRRKFNPSSHSFIWRCLLFWYLFPTNYEFYMDDIIQLWIAQGYIHIPLNQVKTMEDIGILLFEEFGRLQVIILSHIDSSTGRLRYKLNPTFVDQLQGQPNENNHYYRLDNVNAYISESTLHASLRDTIDLITFKDLYQAKKLYTLLILHEQGSRLHQIPRDLFLKLPSLRALDLSHTCITELPNSIGNLEDLRYLNLSGTLITTLPESLCDLYQMQTLKLKGCLKLLRLPKGMSKLINLRHLDVDVSCLLVSMPPRFGDLVELQTLPAFFVGKENGCHITELKNMANLRGTFRILRLENVSGSNEAKEAALHQKKYLDKLEYHWTKLQDGLDLLENLQPHAQVQELQIVGYAGAKFPSWIGNPIFSILTAITIHDCRNCQLLPRLGKLPSLKTLCLSNMVAVSTIDDQFCGRDTVSRVRDFVRFRGKRSASNTSVAFRTLETLTLKSLLSLEEWIGMKELDFPHLEKLNISDCPKLTALPKISFLDNLKKLEISFCSSLKSFPNEGLPISLQDLVITDCPVLKEQCHKDKGEDWRKLVLVPNVWIDYQLISQNEGEKNDKPTTTPSNPRSFLSIIILKYFRHKGETAKYVSNDGKELNYDSSGKYSSNSVPPTPRSEGEILQSSNLKSFSFSELKNATRNFRPDSVLGEGGFGSVFKGWIDENALTATKPGTGIVIAVKRLNQEGFQGHREWLVEVNYLGQLYHPNLVRLIGYCLEDEHRLLVYEFMPRGSLKNHLFRRGSYFQPLSWSLRMKVALGAAKGLAFLHSAETKVIYRDFKTSNILLDSNYNAKLSDFGLAKDGPTGDKSHVSTRVMATYGYAAPEYLATVLVSFFLKCYLVD